MLVADTSPIRVFIVDDDPAVREGLHELLKHIDGLVSAGKAASAEETLETISETDTDVAFVDISMDGMDGIELTRRLLDQYSDLRVLIVSVHDETHYVEVALDAGASGYVLKNRVPTDLEKAVFEVVDGGVYISQNLKDRMGS